MRRHHLRFLAQLGLGLSALTLSACGDPCIDDGAGKPGAECTPSASSDSDSNTSTETSDTNTSNTETMGETMEGTTDGPEEEWCTDEDMDGFGDPENCVPVPEGEDPPEGSVPADQATDCDDDDADTFPGAAPNDDADACMTDADGDDWGDDNPSNPNAVPGTDCDDANIKAFPGAAENEDPPDQCMEDDDEDGWGDSNPSGMGTIPGFDCNDDDASVLMCEIWCPDLDIDGFGDPEGCVLVDPNGEDPPPPDYVMDNTDCDDDDFFTFPGAAQNDDPEACMTDADSDGWGDDMPAEGVTPGRDCDDSDNDSVVCVDAIPACADTTLMMSTQLMVTATGGDGNYTYSWEPPETLDDASLQNPQATPTDITTYTVTATDGSMNSGTDQITVHVTDKAWVLGGVMDAECEAVGLSDAPADHDFSQDGTETCTTTNGQATAFICPVVHEQARITGTMTVTDDEGDDDWVGFVWGWQDTNQFYLLHWKAALQVLGNCDGVAGIVVKKIDVTVPPLNVADLGCGIDTPNATVLAMPADTYDQGWVEGVEYGVEIEYAQDQTEITITNLDDNSELTSFVVMDDSYPSGQFGTYDWSQPNACNGPWQSSCL